MGHLSNRFVLVGTILVFAPAFAIADAHPTDLPANMSSLMCEPPVMFFYTMSVGATDAVISIGGLNQTVSLFGVESDGSSWHTRWANVSKEDPEMDFLLEMEHDLRFMLAYFDKPLDFVGLRFECPLTLHNLTCTIKLKFDSYLVEFTGSTPEPSPYMDVIEDVAKGFNIDILRNNSEALVNRWGPVCTAIANVSDPNHMTLTSQKGEKWITCNATTPSPTRFWIQVNDSNTLVDMNGTYTTKTEYGWAFMNVSTTGPDPSCNAESILGWTVTANETEPVYEMPTFARLVGGSGPEASREGYGGQNYDFLVVLIIIVLLILAVVYLFFKNQIHVWMIQNVLTRFGAYNKPPPPPPSSDLAECRPMI